MIFMGTTLDKTILISIVIYYLSIYLIIHIHAHIIHAFYFCT